MILDSSFYLNENVLDIAKKLLGKYLCTNIDNKLTSGKIIEVEAYRGAFDKASHAYNNRRTKRTEVMFEKGGVAYIYLCYGMHHLLNVVTNKSGIPDAVLIRAIEPDTGINIILKRRNKKNLDKTLCSGPGTLSKALGITKKLNNISFTSDKIWIEDRTILVEDSKILSLKRIGIDYAKEDKDLLYRFKIKD